MHRRFDYRYVVPAVMITVLLSALLVVALNFSSANDDVDWASLDATVLSQPRTLHPILFRDDRGRVFNNQSLQGHWSLLFFGFTHCPTMCPTTMAAVKQMRDIVLAEHKVAAPQVVFITIDPERDKQAQLHAYVKAFDPSFTGLRGSKKALERVTQELGIAYSHNHDAAAGNYQISHTGAVVLLDPRGQLVAFFTYPQQPKQMAHEYSLIVSKMG